MRTQLDVQLTVNKGAGDLTLTLIAIRTVLGEYEAREMCRQIELDKTGSAFAARPTQPSNPSRDIPDPPRR
eukprot:4365706-Pleurochrysis_carterae.AAC.1